MALPKIDPLNTEFDMPQSGGNDVQREITKLGEVIIDKTSAGLKAATKVVIGDVPRMIADLTKEIESGPVDNFAIGINKLIKLVDDLGLNLRDYNTKLADTVDEFTGNQQQLEKKISELREQDIRAEINKRGDAVKILTEKEIKEKELQIQINNNELKNSSERIKEFSTQLNLLKDDQTDLRDEIENRIEAESDQIKFLESQNENLKKSTSTTADTGKGQQGFGQLAQLKEAFMVIPDTIAEVATSFQNVGKTVFGGVAKFFTDGPMKSIKSAFVGIANIFKTARIMIALKVMAVIAAFQFFAERIDQIGNFFVGIWEKITGFFQGIVDWFKNSKVGKFFFGGDDDKEEKKQLGNRDPKAGTAGDIAGEASFADFDDGDAPIRNMSSARLEDGLENQVIQTNMSDFDDNSAKIISQREMQNMDGMGSDEIDYTGVRGGVRGQLGIKEREIVGNQTKSDDDVSTMLGMLNSENARLDTGGVVNIQNNSNVSSQSSSGTTVSGFIDHEPDTSFKFVRSGATGSDEF